MMFLLKSNHKTGEISIENEIVNGLGDGLYKIIAEINNQNKIENFLI